MEARTAEQARPEDERACFSLAMHCFSHACAVGDQGVTLGADVLERPGCSCKYSSYRRLALTDRGAAVQACSRPSWCRSRSRSGRRREAWACRRPAQRSRQARPLPAVSVPRSARARGRVCIQHILTCRCTLDCGGIPLARLPRQGLSQLWHPTALVTLSWPPQATALRRRRAPRPPAASCGSRTSGRR